MATILANLSVQHQVEAQTASYNGEVSSYLKNRQALEAKFFVTPDAVPEAQGLGYIEVTVSIPNPHKPFPEMTPDQTREWLVDLLKKTM